jgi:hypothetical protein
MEGRLRGVRTKHQDAVSADADGDIPARDRWLVPKETAPGTSYPWDDSDLATLHPGTVPSLPVRWLTKAAPAGTSL